MPVPLLAVHGLRRHFAVRRGVVLSRSLGTVKAVDGVDFSIGAGETFGLVGESGCGKTTLSRMILLLEQPDGGEIAFRGTSALDLEGAALRAYRAVVQAVFQDPYSSLSPRMRVADIVAEPMRAAGRLPRRAIAAEVKRLLHEVGLRPDAAELYPHEFSGGQRQRIAIARALSTRPALIVLDEPVSALDISVRAQILNLLRDIQQATGVGFLLISHDLAVVRYMSTMVGVMYLGRIVEIAPAAALYAGPLHPYTRALLAAALPTHPDRRHESTASLSGDVPSPLDPPSGCRFRTRCPAAMPRCASAVPEMKRLGTNHLVACHLHDGPAQTPPPA